MVEPRPTGRFPRTQRIRRRTEFQRVTKEGRRVVTSHFVLFLRATVDGSSAGSEVPPARLGITVSRKRGGAVARNRYKRLIREAFRATRALWFPGIDLVVLVRASLGRACLVDVVRQLDGAASRIAQAAEEALHDGERRRSQLAPPL